MVIKYVVATRQMSTYLIHNDHTNTTITNFHELRISSGAQEQPVI
jgi:hypothetical protein